MPVDDSVKQLFDRARTFGVDFTRPPSTQVLMFLAYVPKTMGISPIKLLHQAKYPDGGHPDGDHLMKRITILTRVHQNSPVFRDVVKHRHDRVCTIGGKGYSIPLWFDLVKSLLVSNRSLPEPEEDERFFECVVAAALVHLEEDLIPSSETHAYRTLVDQQVHYLPLKEALLQEGLQQRREEINRVVRQLHIMQSSRYRLSRARDTVHLSLPQGNHAKLVLSAPGTGTVETELMPGDHVKAVNLVLAMMTEFSSAVQEALFEYSVSPVARQSVTLKTCDGQEVEYDGPFAPYHQDLPDGDVVPVEFTEETIVALQSSDAAAKAIREMRAKECVDASLESQRVTLEPLERSPLLEAMCFFDTVPRWSAHSRAWWRCACRWPAAARACLTYTTSSVSTVRSCCSGTPTTCARTRPRRTLTCCSRRWTT